MKVTILIPARMAATRFPGKPLSIINGRPMIQWVYERSARSSADRVLVATDSEEILTAVRAFGGEAILTGSHHQNGTQRIAEAAAGIDADIVVNVQGDEPCIHPDDIDAAVAPLRLDPNLPMGTLASRIQSRADLFDPNVVKVVFNRHGAALYFSRSAIPYRKHEGMSDASFDPGPTSHYRHIGVYAYRRNFLLAYVNEPTCSLEETEGLEQLRALYMGAEIRVTLTHNPSIGVDTPRDVAKAEAYLKGIVA